mgnify:FL=1
MDTIVLKFGGSSVSDNIRLNQVAEKIISLKNEKTNIVVVVSAQGKTTDKLIKEACELSALPTERELDVLLSSGEQISMAKLSILLNRLGYKAKSLTGWQAGIFTNNVNQNAIIENIDTSRIEEELKDGYIVIVAGFQGINENKDITTLGRGGSDTTAVALASSLKAKHCYIFSDVDGIYTSDPNKIKTAVKLEELTYEEMLDMSSEGAKVLHNRCVEIGQKFQIPIVARSTFNDKPGTVVSNTIIEDSNVKSIVKNDDIIYVTARAESYSVEIFNKIYKTLIENDLHVNNLVNSSGNQLEISFTIKSNLFNKFANLLENQLSFITCTYFNISRVSIIGHGIMNNNEVLNNTMKIIKKNDLEILSMEVNESKIAIMFKEIISNKIVNELHDKLIIKK